MLAEDTRFRRILHETQTLQADIADGYLRATVLRVDADPEYGTFGVWLFEGRAFCVTLEPRDRADVPVPDKRVAIPEEVYLCKRVTSPLVTRLTKGAYTETFEVQHVPGRTLVRVHPGNTDDDTEGCILVGSSYGKLQGDRAIINSGATFAAWMERLAGIDKFILTVRGV